MSISRLLRPIVRALDALSFPFRTLPAVRLRSFLYRRCLLAECGPGLKIKCGAMIDSPENIRFGRNVSVGEFAFLSGNGGIRVGDDVMIGHQASIISAMHSFSDSARTMRAQGLQMSAVDIGSDVWIGAGARILPGKRVGRGAVVGANAVVSEDVPEFAIVGGVPAKVIGRRG